jgi:hypothetical protein
MNREELASRLLVGMIQGSMSVSVTPDNYEGFIQGLARAPHAAVVYADALIAELAKPNNSRSG